MGNQICSEHCRLTLAELPPSPSLHTDPRLGAPAKALALLSCLQLELVSALQCSPGLWCQQVSESCQPCRALPPACLLPCLALQSPFRLVASRFGSTAARCNPQIRLSAQTPPSSVSSVFNSVPDSHLHHTWSLSHPPTEIPCWERRD